MVIKFLACSPIVAYPERSAFNRTRDHRFTISHWWRSPLYNGQLSVRTAFLPATSFFSTVLLRRRRRALAVVSPILSPSSMRIDYGSHLSRLKTGPYICTPTFSDVAEYVPFELNSPPLGPLAARSRPCHETNRTLADRLVRRRSLSPPSSFLTSIRLSSHRSASESNVSGHGKVKFQLLRKSSNGGVFGQY